MSASMMMTRSKTPAVVFLGLALSGCAVLTIDVDVYKGPLANHESIQVQQAAVLAIGAKPLLISMRDRLENAERKKAGYEQKYRKGERIKEKIQDDGSYKARYISDFSNSVCTREKRKKGKCFESERALRVNAVLSLYEDAVEDKRTALFLERAEESVRKYSRAYDNLTPNERDKKYAEAVKSVPLNPVHSSYQDKIAKLKSEYLKFIYPGAGIDYRSKTLEQILVFHSENQSLWDSLGKGKAAPAISTELKGLLKRADPKLKYSLIANLVFEKIASEGFLEFHAELLFGRAEDRQEFIKKVREISRSFFDAREQLEELWLLTLDFLSGMSEEEYRNLYRSPEKQIALGRVISLSVQLLSPLRFSVLMEKNQEAKNLFDGQRFRNLFAATVGAKKRKSSREVGTYEEDLRREMAELMARHPREAALSLKAAHVMFKTGGVWTASLDPPLDEFASWEERKFGIVRGPTISRNEIEKSSTSILRAGMGEIAASYALGLERGRPLVGLERTIEDFLAVNDPSSSASQSEDQKRAKGRLFDILTQFAEKALFVAHFQRLLEDPLSPADESGEKEVSLLQAVGNAILTQVNALRELEADKAGRPLRGEMEATALESLGPSGPGAGLTGKPEDSKVKKDPARVVDRLISKLAYERVEALKKHGPDSPEAKKYQAAIEAALEERARMAYLRSASEFLRNSFLYTGLQETPLSVWDNDLFRHFLKQLPLAGIINVQAKKNTIEFDKQFWQNINRVRLSGAGLTTYAVVKDDVGNWYVKDFGADPSRIIEAAKSMALFAAKGALRAKDVKKAADALKGREQPGEAFRSDAQKDLMTAQWDAAAASHNQQFAPLLRKMNKEMGQESISNLKDEIVKKWEAANSNDQQKDAKAKRLAFALDLADAKKPSPVGIPPADGSPSLHGAQKAQEFDKPFGDALDRFEAYRQELERNLDDRLINQAVEGEQKKLKENDEEHKKLKADLQQAKAEEKALIEKKIQDREKVVEGTDKYKNLQKIKDATFDLSPAKKIIRGAVNGGLVRFIEQQDEIKRNYRTRLLAIAGDKGS